MGFEDGLKKSRNHGIVGNKGRKTSWSLGKAAGMPFLAAVDG
jgi:hypothetical protein